ncbi:hypothetical protein ACFRMN_01050 [Streptomyces sp. NPDC056835]|uniref:hypothetical protein n=1 Tax=Streptomyces sp. NPDC056835 TaxID=3345956 RepID=UPI0036D0C59A
MTVSPQDPALKPLDFDQEVYEQEVYELVRDTAPRLFAVVEEYRVGTEDADAVVVAWGLAYESGEAEVVRVGGGSRWRLASAERVMWYFGRAAECAPRLVWLAPPDTGERTRPEAA